jgi:tripartite-type tricarboxylate transporter receptor subunit TctC
MSVRHVLLFAFALIGGVAHAQGVFPSKPIRFIVPYPPGGTVDIVGRVLAERLSGIFGQSVVVENRAGGGGQTGTTFVAKQALADGYTLVVNSSAPLATGISLYPSMPYDVEKDLVAVTLLAENAIVFAAHPSFPAQSLKEVVEISKARPEGIRLGIPSAGSMHHLTAEQFRLVTGAKATLVPYKGDAPVVNDSVAGHLDMSVLNLPSSIQHIRSGRLKALAVTSKSRSDQLPNVATTAEAGLPELECTAWFAVMAPVATPKDVVAKLHEGFVKALESAEVKQKLAGVGANAIHSTPEQTAAFIKKEVAHWAKIAKASGAKFE